MNQFKIIDVGTTESTNTAARELPVDGTTPTVVISDNQTAGRGQRGNSWESEPGKNLTFSLVVYPRFISPAAQFELSMLVSLGIVSALDSYIEGQWLSIKWPNDIYFGDRKIAGILIENSLSEHSIERSIIGIGLNVNQTTFKSDAPNPISLTHATGLTLDRQKLLDAVCNSIIDYIYQYESDPEPDELAALYNNRLWRKDGQYHVWHDVATDKDFSGMLLGVGLDGRISIVDTEGTIHTYLFKEVQAVL